MSEHQPKAPPAQEHVFQSIEALAKIEKEKAYQRRQVKLIELLSEMDPDERHQEWEDAKKLVEQRERRERKIKAFQELSDDQMTQALGAVDVVLKD
jgi:hypothetical protein